MRRYSHHGKCHDPIYAIWSGIIGRCRNPKNAAYHNYGGRGIAVCERWLEFINFYADVGDPPAGLSLDRINNDLGYFPGNVRWATRVEQSRNRRSLHMLTVDGETLSMGEWAERSGLRVGTIWQRLKLGWTDELAVKTPIVQDRRGKPKGHRWADPSASSGRHVGCGNLTAEQIQNILRTPKGQGSGRSLARRYGVSETMVSAIRNGKRGVEFHDGDRAAAGDNLAAGVAA